MLKQREASFVNDINRIEKKLTDEMDYSKKLENKLSNIQKDLQLAQKQNAEMQKILERTKSINEFANIELQQQLKALQQEKEEIIKRENTRIKVTNKKVNFINLLFLSSIFKKFLFPKFLQDAESLYENTRTKYAEEISTLKSNYESELVKLKKTIDYLNEMINDIKGENSVLNKSLMETKAKNTKLRNNYDFIIDRNDDLQEKLKEATEMTQIKSVDNRKLTSESTKTQHNVSKRL